MRALGALREQRAFLAVAMAYVGFGVAAKLAGLPIRIMLYSVMTLSGLFVLANGFLLWRIFVLARSGVRGRPTLLLYRDFREHITPDRLIWAAPAVVLIPAVISVYTSFKCMIGELTWDIELAAWDRALHGGDPWHLLQPWLGHYWISYLLARIYWAWFLIFQMVLMWQAFGRGPAREQFFVSSVLTWGVLGTVGAKMFASAGPVFYGRLLGGPDPFEEVVAYVHTLPAWSWMMQDWLWAAYQRGDLAGFGKGISAMPSLHVAVATLNALVAWRHNRTVGIAFAVYAALVALASVHLGWHYAIDAYAGAAAALVIWWVVGLALRRAPQLARVAAE
jgi:hypothetical protein